MAHENINERRAHVQALLDQDGSIPSPMILQIAHQFGCGKTAIYRDIAFCRDPLTGSGYRDMDAVYTQNSRAQRLGIPGTLTVREWRALRERYNNRCARCGGVKPLGPDHIKPLSRGGTNVISNIQPLCLSCNVSKHDKTRRY